MPSNAHCIVPGCSNRKSSCKFGLFETDDANSQGRKVFVKRRLCGSDLARVGCGGTAEVCKAVSFHRLPKDSDRRRHIRAEWLAKIPRVNTPLSGNSYVCGVHFPGGRPVTEDEPPSRFLDKAVVVKRKSRVSTGEVSRPVEAIDIDDDVDLPVTDESVPEAATLLADHDYGEVPVLQENKIKTLEAQVAKLRSQLEQALYNLDESEEALRKCQLHYSNIRHDNKIVLFYTGLSSLAFDLLLDQLRCGCQDMCFATKVPADFLGQDSRGRRRALVYEDELLLTLVKLRHAFPESDLALRFGIDQSTVSRIFSTYIRCMYFSMKEVDIWPSRALIDRYMPDVFKDKYPRTRVIIDATEFPIEKPANPTVQAATWSNYKNRNTFKLLVGVTPTGAISFLSPLYGGRISDKKLTKRSGLMKLMEKGDAIMADRGFDIADLLPEGVDLNIPPFLGSRDQLDEEEVIETRRIASVRIHVERAMERIKNFRITHFLSSVLCPLAEQIIFVCAFLTNYMEPLVPPPVSKPSTQSAHFSSAAEVAQISPDANISAVAVSAGTFLSPAITASAAASAATKLSSAVAATSAATNVPSPVAATAAAISVPSSSVAAAAYVTTPVGNVACDCCKCRLL
ncbi:uncharacterized protein LOC135827887 [Sycon ciliatum]|uniref:uncharacterized protein LOC135826754 n=1 Tax=Sycon ciliatum TaxID=27933 RepID=UPI0031F5F7E6